ncbi:MliC family protein [Patescibacteria group bacterium]|nr:MliC family protein [Patescibacteria group bacterium]
MSAGYFAWLFFSAPRISVTVPIASVSYVCDAGKTIQADYYTGVSRSGAPGQPPVPGGSVHIVLSDGRDLILPQTLSASGIRYSDGDPSVPGNESIVFWSKGNTAFVLEHNSDMTYRGCIKVVPDTGGTPQTYESGSNGFSIRYPAGYTADQTYVYTELGPNTSIAGVKFTIPSALASGTNLSSGSYISVEEIPNTHECTAGLFLPPGVRSGAPLTITDQGTTYSVASSTDAAVGNRYEEDVYAIPGTDPCIAVRYFIHWSVLENYPQGSVNSFDRDSLLAQFDAVRRTLTLGQ